MKQMLEKEKELRKKGFADKQIEEWTELPVATSL
jgi:hypothetical protein